MSVLQLFEDTECGNGYVEVGEECDCGPREVSSRDTLDSTQRTSVFYTSILYTPTVFSCVCVCICYRSALKSAVKSVLCLTVLTAVTDPAAITHVW